MKNFSFWRVVVATAFAVIFSAPVYAQEQGQVQDAAVSLSKQRYDEGVKLYQQGDYVAAFKLFNQSAEIAKNESGEKHLDYIEAVNCIALCYYATGNYAKSIEILEPLIKDAKECLGENSAYYATYLNNLASSYYSIANYSKSIELHTECLKVRKIVLGEASPEYSISLKSLVETYSAAGDYDTAIKIGEEALNVAKKAFGENHLIYSNILGALAACYASKEDHRKAIELQSQALTIQKEQLGENTLEYAFSLNTIGYCYGEIKEFAKAIEYTEKSYEIIKMLLGGEHPYCATMLTNLAALHNGAYNYSRAIDLLTDALSVYKSNNLENHPHYANALINLANYYNTIGDYAKGIEKSEQALIIYKSVYGENHNQCSLALSCIALNYSGLGEYSKALELNKRALDICEKTIGKENISYAFLLNNIAVSYASIGDRYKSMDIYRQSLSILERIYGERHISFVSTLLNLSRCYNDIGDYRKAIEYAERALGILNDNYGVNNHEYAGGLSMLAQAYCEIGDYAKSIKLHEQALAIQKNSLGENHPLYAYMLHSLAYNYFKKRDFTKAIESCKQALAIKKITLDENHPKYATTLSDLGCNYYHSKSFSEIPLIWQETFKINKQFILSQFSSLIEKHRESIWQKNKGKIIISLHQYAPLCKESAEASKIAYNSLLFSKGLILSSSIEFDRVIKASGNEELLAQFEELRTTRAILNTYYNKPISERPKGEVERLEARAEELEKIMIAGSKEYADFTKYLNVEWENVRDALGENEVAIEFLAAEQFIDETEPYYAAMVLRKGWDAPKYVDLLSAKELKEYCVRGSMMYSGHGAFELYNHIWAKLGEYINEGDNVYFSPDGLLHQINIELFYDVERKRANEKYNLYRVSSTREVCLDRETSAQKSAILYGGLKYDMSNDSLILESKKYDRGESSLRTFRADSTMKTVWSPLPATKVEVENIDAVCQKHNIASNIYATTVGNEESFKALSGKKTPILHLATHGFFYKNEEAKKRSFFEQFDMTGQQSGGKVDNSLKRSGLILAGAQRAWNGEEIPANVEDGILLAEEISTMDLSGTDIVVLSACETGLGEITSDGVFGLQRAFKKAGVKTLIMSLWKVDDEATSLFMQSFYKAWLSGKSKHDAFAFAQKTVREYSDDTKSFKNPKYWAAFILLDDYQK